MLFHTWVFFVFFLIVYPVFLLVKKNNHLMNLWLMIASYTFYGWWNPYYLLLLFGTSAVDYLMVLFMARSQKTRKLWLVISLVSNFGFLAYFKYSGFITENLNTFLATLGSPYQLPDPIYYPNRLLGLLGVPESHFFESVILPIGISFHTFQSMSYTIDAYRGTIETERSFIRFLTFVSFFPQLVAGPIERARNLLPQLQREPRITREDINDGLALFLVGFFKKVALADYLSLYVDQVYAAPGRFQAPALLLATFAFAWQIYFDFSGYTDMARGIARLMGFHLMLNFNNPYVATGLGDFWARWHISLSTWFKDYVYYPLGGNRHGLLATYRNMILTMVISGIWHGANWTFVIWGGLHALGRLLTRELERTHVYRERVPTFVKQLFVFTFVMFTWIFFRAQNVSEAWLIVTRILTSGWADPRFPLLMLLLIFAVWMYEFLYNAGAKTRFVLQWAPLRVGLVAGMIAYLAVVAQPSTKAFIYFQF
ncbi:MAG TPA: MBOAT family O-acyltransferase [Gemmataceae bacterium]|jgi:D-alanyl-lipoteichoic acid acyltransferase DltB (MBOAT superfamily)|nr:MBOAT family O-acyltransferase [Gemmataceae bacterium]